MQHIVKIFSDYGKGLEDKVNAFMADWEAENLGHLHVFGCADLHIEKIGGTETQVWVTFERQPLSDF